MSDSQTNDVQATATAILTACNELHTQIRAGVTDQGTAILRAQQKLNSYYQSSDQAIRRLANDAAAWVESGRLDRFSASWSACLEATLKPRAERLGNVVSFVPSAE